MCSCLLEDGLDTCERSAGAAALVLNPTLYPYQGRGIGQAVSLCSGVAASWSGLSLRLR